MTGYVIIYPLEGSETETAISELHIKPQVDPGSYPTEIPQGWYCKGHRCLISATGSSSQPTIGPSSHGILQQQKKGHKHKVTDW